VSATEPIPQESTVPNCDEEILATLEHLDEVLCAIHNLLLVIETRMP